MIASPAVLDESLAREAAAHRALADEAMASAPPYPSRFDGCRIVICASGLRYFVCVWICVRMLQRLRCRLPRGGDRQRFTDAWAEGAGKAGWELKPYSIVESRFREALLLDAV